MRISVVTPTLNCAASLPHACMSVRDSADHPVEHVVIDGGSRDGTVPWLEGVASHARERTSEPGDRPDEEPAAGPAASSEGPSPCLRWLSEPDLGMYDARNKGVELASGEWIGFLNADEQYLEGALAAVADASRRHPDADILYGDCLLVRPDGTFIAWRRSAPPQWPLIAASHLYVPSCATFFSRRIFEAGHRFDPGVLAADDGNFMIRLLKAGYRAVRIDRPLAAFTLTGRNVGSSHAAGEELRRISRGSPAWIRMFRPALRLALWAAKAACGAYRPPRRLEYALYVGPDANRRTRFTAARPDWRWPDA